MFICFRLEYGFVHIASLSSREEVLGTSWTLWRFRQAISKAGLSLGGMLMLRSLLEEMLDSWVAGKLVDSTEPMAMTTIFTILYSIIPIETWIELSRNKLSFLTWEDIQNLKLLECLVVNVLVLGFFHKMWYDMAVQLPVYVVWKLLFYYFVWHINFFHLIGNGKN